MKTREIKELQVVRVEYIAEDGEVFYRQEDCEQYEKSILFVAKKNLTRLNTEYMSVYDLLLEGCDDTEVEVFDIQTEKDLDNLKKYLYLNARQHGASEFDLEHSDIQNITIGHEVIIWWSYDKDNFYIQGNGSLDSYLEFIRNNFKTCLEKKRENPQ